MPGWVWEALSEGALQDEVPFGTTILRRGEAGRGLFFLRSGQVRVIDDRDPAQPVTLAILGPGSVFGERSLVLGQPVGATVRAASDVALSVLSPSGFADLLLRHPDLRHRMEEGIARYDRANAIRSAQGLGRLGRTQVERLVDAARQHDLAPGSALPPNDGLSLVLTGRLTAALSAGHGGLTTDRIPGELVGLRELADPAAPPLVYLAAEPTRILAWPRSVVVDLLEEAQETAESLRTEGRRRAQRLATLTAPPDTPDRAGALAGGDILESVAVLGRQRFPLRTTADPRLAGLAALATAAARLGASFDAGPAISERLTSHRDGGLESLAMHAEGAGLQTRMIRQAGPELAGQMLPLVWQDRSGRWRAALGRRGGRLVVVDPVSGVLTREAPADLRDTWPDQVLSLSRVPDLSAGAPGTSLLTRLSPLLLVNSGLVVPLLALAAIGLALGLLMPFALALVVDHVLVLRDLPLLVLMLVGLLAASVTVSLSEAARNLLLLHAGSRVNEILANTLFTHLMRARMDLLMRWQRGQIVCRFEEVEKLFMMGTAIAQVVLLDGLGALAFGGMLLVLDPRLGLVTLAFAAVAAAVLIWASPRLRRAEIAHFEAQAVLQSHLIETVQGIETLRYAGSEEQVLEQGLRLFRNTTAADIAGARLAGRVEIAVWLTMTLGGTAVLVLGARQVMAGAMTAGELLAVSGLAAGFSLAILHFARVFDQIQHFRVSLARVTELLALPVERQGVGLPCPPLKGAIRLSSVRFSYGADAVRPVLDGVSLDIPAGSRVALVGPSGSGKTTLLRLLNRLVDPQEGQVLIDGLDVAKVDPETLRRQIGVVEQVPHVFAATIRDNIARGAGTMPQDRIARAARISGAARFIEQLPLGYGTRVGEGGRSLSGGQAQRLAIARAIAADPAILLLDEATAALDPEAEAEVRDGLARAMAGRTVIAVAHRLRTAREADLIVVMDAGRIVQTGTHAALVETPGLYRDLVQQGDDP